MKIELRFFGGARDGEQLELPASDRVRIGRHPDNDVVFDVQQDLNVSGHHAELRRQEEGYYLYDMGSSNGTFVAGQKVTQVRVASDQEFTFGPDGPRLRVRFVDDAPTMASEELAKPTENDVVAPSGGAAVAAQLGAEQKVGARTVGLMIDSALKQSRGEKKSSVGRSTVFMRNMVNQAVTTSTRRFKVVSLLLLLLLIGTVAGFIGLRYYERSQASVAEAEVRAQMAKLMDQQRSASSNEKQRLATQLEALSRKLMKSQPAATGKQIVTRNMKAVFLVAYTDPARGSRGFCSAFAVRRRVLGTNAHCIIALEKYRSKGYTAFVVMNRNPKRRYSIARLAHHPRYHKPRRTISQDVGLIEVDADLPVQVKIADSAQLKELESGGLMYMYGFPGRLANVSSPAATLVQGVIGRVTKLDGRFGTVAENKLIQHSAFTSGGTSGSPIFNERGNVIAVNTGGYVEPGSLQIMDPSTGKAGRVMVAKQLAGYNFGIRVDVLLQLMDDLGK